MVMFAQGGGRGALGRRGRGVRHWGRGGVISWWVVWMEMGMGWCGSCREIRRWGPRRAAGAHPSASRPPSATMTDINVCGDELASHGLAYKPGLS